LLTPLRDRGRVATLPGMTVDELLRSGYAWSDVHAPAVMLTAAGLPIVGTIAAKLAHLAPDERGARGLASALVGAGLVGVVVLAGALLVAHTAYEASPLDANPMLLLAPIVLLAGAVVGARRVAPLSELGSVRTAVDLGAFVVAASVATWLLSRFQWGAIFHGSIVQLLVLGLLGVLLVRRLARRAFGGRSEGERQPGDGDLPYPA
jgi:hypothetical protein